MNNRTCKKMLKMIVALFVFSPFIVVGLIYTLATSNSKQ